MRRNVLDTRPQDATTWPRFTVDMGYSTKRDFPRLIFDEKYTGIFRYPITTTLSEPSGNTQGPNSRPFGPDSIRRRVLLPGRRTTPARTPCTENP